MKKVICVCTGNTCRSPMAAAFLQRALPDWDISSAGLFASSGQGAAPEAVAAPAEDLPAALLPSRADEEPEADVPLWHLPAPAAGVQLVLEQVLWIAHGAPLPLRLVSPAVHADAPPYRQLMGRRGACQPPVRITRRARRART